VNFLFVHQNFPGQYLHILRCLLEDNKIRDDAHEIVFMTEPNNNRLFGIRKVTYARPPKSPDSVHRDAGEFDVAMRRAEAAAIGAHRLKMLGFTPDIIIGHHGWGELLNLADVFPGVPMLGYFEFYYRTENADVNCDPEFPLSADRFGGVRAKNAVNLQAFALQQHGQVPTRWQLSTYPEWARGRMHLLEEGVDLTLCRPDPAAFGRTLEIGGMQVLPEQKLLTYVARNLEPYRGFHSFMRALPAILQARPDVVVSVVGGDEISYGAAHPKGPWREVMLAQLRGQLDLSRIHFLGKIPYEFHLKLLQRSDAHVYLSYPFVASWSLREALACGCVVVGGDTPTVTEFVRHNENGMIVPFLDSAAIAQMVLRVLADGALAARLRSAARADAERRLDLNAYLARYRALIEQVAGKQLIAPQAASIRARAARER
jgi:glycosyltransferase involved in cell wall biosynthesis